MNDGRLPNVRAPGGADPEALLPLGVGILGPPPVGMKESVDTLMVWRMGGAGGATSNANMGLLFILARQRRCLEQRRALVGIADAQLCQ